MCGWESELRDSTSEGEEFVVVNGVGRGGEGCCWCGHQFGAGGGEGLEGGFEFVVERIRGGFERLDASVVALVRQDYLIVSCGRELSLRRYIRSSNPLLSSPSASTSSCANAGFGLYVAIEATRVASAFSTRANCWTSVLSIV